MTDSDKIIIARHILSSDDAFESDCVQMNIVNNKPVTEREKAMANVISKLYRLLHPSPECPHPEWEKEICFYCNKPLVRYKDETHTFYCPCHDQLLFSIG